MEWQRNLWQQQPYPDNYVPTSFLSSLRRNTNFRPYAYLPMVSGALAICQHLTTIFVFLTVFVYLKDQILDPRVLVWILGAGFMLGYLMWEVLVFFAGTHAQIDRAKIFKSSILVFLVLMALAPVLRTLSAATSSDSIWALTAVLFILNALLTNYNPTHPSMHMQERFTSVISINAAISASVVLSSRLHDDISVFALVLFAVELFALYPMLRRWLQSFGFVFFGLLSCVWAGASIALMLPLSVPVAALFGSSLLVIAVIAPALLVWAQKFKNEIRGPWDVAIPRVK